MQGAWIKRQQGARRIDLVAFKLVLALEPLKTIEEADRLTVLAVLLHGDDVYLEAALKTVVQCGLNSLEILQVIYNAKFEILGINATMLQLRNGL